LCGVPDPAQSPARGSELAARQRMNRDGRGAVLLNGAYPWRGERCRRPRGSRAAGHPSATASHPAVAAAPRKASTRGATRRPLPRTVAAAPGGRCPIKGDYVTGPGATRGAGGAGGC
jgi:hypothetical protein